MDKRFSSEVPEKLGKYRNGLVLNYAIRESTEEEILQEWQNGGRMEAEGEEPTADFISQHKYTYYTLNIPMGQWKYDGVVNAIIRDKYRSDEMEAITNNMAAVNAVFLQTLVTEGIIEATKYLKDSVNEINSTQFREMQEWRRLAKDTAREIFPNA